MTEMSIFGNRITSVFELLGTKENNISYSVGFSLARSPAFLENFLKYLNITIPFEPKKIKIHLQEHQKNGGFTDFEIIQEGEFHLIIEAKRGWHFPGVAQVTKYVSRPTFLNSTAKDKRILVFNESIPAYTNVHFGISVLLGIPVQVISWRDIQAIVQKSKVIGKDADNRMLKELNIYLEKISTMQKKDSNWVYVVSLSKGIPDPSWAISFRDIVEKHQKYFHPVGGGKGGWPPEPPNYIAFRYDGKLQSIHHIENYQVFQDPSLHFSTIPKGIWPPHYLYELGPAIRPGHTVLNGSKIVRSMRVWAMLDLLLTCTTIADARDQSKKR
ncbi:MAG: hypothetical protein ACO1N9_07330 [Flavobacterium sp.]